MSRYEKMSDLDFIDLLQSKLRNSSWNVGEIVELERRGIEILDQDSELARALLKKRSDFIASVNKALEPYSRQFEILSDSINSFKDLKLGKSMALNPKIESQLISTKNTAQELVSNEVANTLKLSLLELRGIRQQNNRDWFQWSMWISSLVAALVALVSLLFSIN